MFFLRGFLTPYLVKFLVLLVLGYGVATILFWTKSDDLLHNGLRLLTKPAKMPSAVLPKEFHYPNAVIERVALFSEDNFFGPDEAAFFFLVKKSNNEGKQDIAKYYMRILKKLNWKIIQYQQKDQAILIMAENRHRRLVTITLRDHVSHVPIPMEQEVAIRLYTLRVPLY